MKILRLPCLVVLLMPIAIGHTARGQSLDEMKKSLLKAATEGDIEKVKSLLEKDVDLNVKNNFGQTPLHFAVLMGHQDIIELLIAKGVLIDPIDNAERTPLHYAAGAGGLIAREERIDIINLLLNRGANVNATDKLKWTPLHYAVYRLRKSTVELLIRKGADINIEDKRGRTPLLVIQDRPTEFRGLKGAEPYLRKIREIQDFLRGNGCVYYVSPSGNDSSSGLLQHPFRNPNTAINIAESDDTILIRGGTYHFLSSIRIHKSGDQNKLIRLFAYPGENPVFDFSEATGDGIFVTGAYWHIKGLTITNAYGWGVRLISEGAHHNILEQITSHSNGASGIVLMYGPTHNLLLNCDAFHNFDPQYNGENASGIGANRGVGKNNVFIGCRTWNNSDNGFEFWQADESIRLEKCYSCRNGENIWDHPAFTGNGTGFKLGMGEGRHVLINCIAWDHWDSGFTLNGNTAGAVLYNCTAWRNNINYQFLGKHAKSILANNISCSGRNEIYSQVDDKLNSWNSATALEINDDDFLSVDDKVIIGPRNSDGSIPENDFLRLVPRSDAIDVGKDVGLLFYGKAPDLGAFEYDPDKTKRQSGIKWMHQAVRDHDIAKIESILAEKTDINEKDWLGYAPLHWACYFGYADVAELLLDSKADPNLLSDTGRMPLGIAKAMEYNDIAELLRKKGTKK